MPHPRPVPDPPHAEGAGLPWDVSVTDAVAAIAEARARHGDTFALRSGDDHYLFTFSPTGVESFYGLPEEKASKGVADYLMLRRKLPDEIFQRASHLAEHACFGATTSPVTWSIWIGLSTRRSTSWARRGPWTSSD